MHSLRFGLSLSALLFVTIAHAADYNMQPGLWEVTTSSDLLRLVPHIPSGQMQDIEALAKEYGVDMPQIANGAAISKVCITQEMANQKTLPNFYQAQAGCTTQNANRSGNHYQLAFSCNGADLKGNGSAEGNLTSAQHFTGQSRFSGTLQGNPVNEKADIQAKWLNTSCGDTPPM